MSHSAAGDEGALPEGWERTDYSGAADVQLGKMLDKKNDRGEAVEYLRNINVRWGTFDLSDLFQMGMTAEERTKFDVRDGDVFVCEGGEPGRAAVWRGDGSDLAFQKALLRIRPKEGISPDWLALNLRRKALDRSLERNFTGTTIKHLPRVALNKTELPLPPLAEQARIVAKLDRLTERSREARAALDRVPALLDRARQAVLAAAVRGTLTAEWRERASLEPVRNALARTEASSQPKGGRKASDSILDGVGGLALNVPNRELPDGWAWTPLSRVARQETGHTPSRSKPDYWDGDIPWIGIKDARIAHGRVIEETLQTVAQSGLDNSASRLLPKGTVCLSRTASVGYVLIMGRAMATSQDFVTWTCGPLLRPRYLMYALMAEGEHIRRFGKGTTHTTIYFPEVRALHLALPSIDEQDEVIARLDAALAHLDALADAAARARADLDRLDRAVLAKAFRGELVPQDPTDEPASALLERVKAAQESHRVGAKRERGA